MALYAIGDVQGCFDELQILLQRLNFDAGRDRIWFTGDLVNRGPQSAEVLRFVRGLGDRAISVLGNHDLHLVAVAGGRKPPSRRDLLDDVLGAPDRHELVTWLRQRPLMHHDPALGYSLIHAGLIPQWTIADAMQRAREAEAVIRIDDKFFQHMYGDRPTRWDEGLVGYERIRFIVNVFTRLRFCDAGGQLLLDCKGAPGSQPAPYRPWFEARHRGKDRIVFGHWSLLGARRVHEHIALDSGCLWGKALTAVQLDAPDAPFIHVPCSQKLEPRDIE